MSALQELLELFEEAGIEFVKLDQQIALAKVSGFEVRISEKGTVAMFGAAEGRILEWCFLPLRDDRMLYYGGADRCFRWIERVHSLQKLPEADRITACDFLDLYDAWSTEYAVRSRAGYGLELAWSEEGGNVEALAEQHPEGHWTLWFGIMGDGTASTRIKFKYQVPKLFRSEDFASFIARFS